MKTSLGKANGRQWTDEDTSCQCTHTVQRAMQKKSPVIFGNNCWEQNAHTLCIKSFYNVAGRLKIVEPRAKNGNKVAMCLYASHRTKEHNDTKHSSTKLKTQRVRDRTQQNRRKRKKNGNNLYITQSNELNFSVFTLFPHHQAYLWFNRKLRLHSLLRCVVFCSVGTWIRMNIYSAVSNTHSYWEFQINRCNYYYFFFLSYEFQFLLLLLHCFRFTVALLEISYYILFNLLLIFVSSLFLIPIRMLKIAEKRCNVMGQP